MKVLKEKTLAERIPSCLSGTHTIVPLGHNENVKLLEENSMAGALKKHRDPLQCALTSGSSGRAGQGKKLQSHSLGLPSLSQKA